MTILHRIRSFLSRRTGVTEAGESETAPHEADDRFAVGQVWRYRTRPHETDSRVIVGKIEVDALGEVVVHVKIVGLQTRNPYNPAKPFAVMTHAPVTEAKVRESVTSLEAQDGDLTGFQESYETWSTAGENGGPAGVFDIPLDQIIAIMEEGLEKGTPVP